MEILFFSLVKKGYGSLLELKSLDTDEILAIIEYENIINDIENLEMEEVRG